MTLMIEQAKPSTYSRKKYDERWKMVNIKPETKIKLIAICEAMSNEYATVAQATVLEILINDKYNTLTYKK